MVQQIVISEETYDILTKLKGKLMSETGNNHSYDDAIQHLIKTQRK